MSSTPARTSLATLAVAIAGVAAFAFVSRGFSVLTAEAARRAAVLESSVSLPELPGVDQSGRLHDMLDDPLHAGPVPRVTIVDFVYTRCETLCSVQGASYGQLQEAIRARHLESKVRLLTISFEPQRDGPRALAQYAQRMRADPDIWTIMSPTSPERLEQALAAFGVVVVPAPLGQLQHNAAFHVLDARGRLVRIVDPGDPGGALDAAIAAGRGRESLA